MLRVLGFIVILGLFGCGGSGDKATTSHTEVHTGAEQPVVVHITAPPGTPFPSNSQNGQITGLVVDDPVVNADVKLFDINNALLETTTSGDEGDFSFNIDTSLIGDGYIITASGGIMNGQPFLGELKAIYTGDDNPDDANLTIMSTLIAKLAATQAGATLIEKRDNAIAQLVFLGLLKEDDYHQIDTELLNENSARIDIAVIGIDAWIDEIINDLADGELSAANMSAFANSNGGILAIKVLGQQETSVWPGASTQIGVELLATTNNVQTTLENAPSWVSLSSDVIEVNPASNVTPGRYDFNLVAGSNLASANKSVSFTVEVLERVLLLSGDLSSVAGTISNEDKDISIAVATGKLSQNYQLSFYAAATGKDTVRFILDSVPEMPDEERIELDFNLPSSEIIIRNHIEPTSDIVAARPAMKSSYAKKALTNYYGPRVPSTCKTSWVDGNNDGHSFNYVWEGNSSFFHDLLNPINNGGDPRIVKMTGRGAEVARCRSTLRSSVSWTSSDLDSKEAVLFVHGFVREGTLGGIDSSNLEYFGSFPKVLSKADIDGRKFNPFLFSWQTNQKFEDVALDLAKAIKMISDKTHTKVHIVAHSYGGLTVRALVQGKASVASNLNPDIAFATKYIASITTIGTPHSGVFSADNGTTIDYGSEAILFPHGTDNTAGLAVNACTAITCYQAGEDWNRLHAHNSKSYYGVKIPSDYGLPDNLNRHTGQMDSVKGYFVYDLAKDLNNYPDIPTQVLLGVVQDSSNIKCVSNDNGTCQVRYSFARGEHLGDGLISLKGQRFDPRNQEVHPRNTNLHNVEENLLNFYNSQSLTRSDMVEQSWSFFDTIEYNRSSSLTFDHLIPFEYGTEGVFTGTHTVLNYQQSLWKSGFSAGAIHMTGSYDSSHGKIRIIADRTGAVTGSNTGEIVLSSEVGLRGVECSYKYSEEASCEHPSWLYVKSFLRANPVLSTIAPEQQISVTGRVQEASQAQSQSAPQLQARSSSTTAVVNVYNGDEKVGSQQVVMGESYDISVPFVASSPYSVEVVPESGSGLRATVSRTITTASSFARSSLNFGIIDLISNALNKNTLNILVIDATSGQPLSGFEYVVRNYNGDFLEDGSESSSQHLLTEKRFGRYHIEITKVGYDKTVNTCTILPLISNQCTLVLSPERTNANGELSAVLTWDLNPRDLDSHLSKYDSNGSELYHLYYSNKTAPGVADSLDLDDTSSYGPETITIDQIDNTAHYIYAVHHFAGNGTISTSSEAQVSLQTETENMQLNAPVSGSGKWWKVFEIVSGQIIPCTTSCIMDARPTQAGKGIATGTVTDAKWLADMEADLVSK
ncbi:MAG: hypothetical protein ABJK37_23105 [Paraglaciecola sp.]|uniref:hypothetical protein n=1 Tax=Paraglaciecola sp. TaxID=1920173 RepID=UPI003296FE9E